MQIISRNRNYRLNILFLIICLLTWFFNNNVLIGQELKIKRYNDYTLQIGPELFNDISSILTIKDSCDALFKILTENKIISESINNLPATERIYDGYLFFNSAENTNSFILLDRNFRETKYLLEANSILILRFDVTSKNIYQLDLTLKKEQSTFLQDIANISGLFGRFKGTPESKVGSFQDNREIVMSLESFQNIGPAPSEISLNVKKISVSDLDRDAQKSGNFDNIISISDNKIYYYTKTQINFNNAEKRFIGLSIGASFSSTTVIKVKKNIDTEWKAKAMLILNIYPGVESEWNPSPKFWEKEFYESFYKRFSIGFGLQIAERPFDKLFLGLGFGLTKAIDLIFGLSFNYEPQENSEILISQVQKFEDIVRLFPHRYELGSYFGLSVRAGELIKVF